ncbi:MAG TPA: thioesterase family protein [Bacteroidota bacterium]|nr:thioesterase family protein [Bacteroidota bacterium]
MEKSQFRHVSRLRVRNYEVDWQGIVHNANYLLYCETGRIEYLKGLGVKLDLHSITNENRVVLVRNEINCRASAFFDEELEIYTRISAIRETSFIFESMIEKSANHELVCDNLAVHVWLDSNREPVRVNDEFRQIVGEFEGSNLNLKRGQQR